MFTAEYLVRSFRRVCTYYIPTTVYCFSRDRWHIPESHRTGRIQRFVITTLHSPPSVLASTPGILPKSHDNLYNFRSSSAAAAAAFVAVLPKGVSRNENYISPAGGTHPHTETSSFAGVPRYSLTRNGEQPIRTNVRGKTLAVSFRVAFLRSPKTRTNKHTAASYFLCSIFKCVRSSRDAACLDA